MKSTTLLSLGLAATLTLVLSACSTNMVVRATPDSSVNYSQYKSYALHSSTAAARQPKFDSTIREAIDASLQGRSFVKTSEANADFLVGYYTVSLTRVRSVEVDDYYTGGANRGQNAPGYNLAIGAASSTDSYYAEGTLIIDIMDAKTGKKIWRGSAEKAIDEDNTDTAMRSIVRTAVTKVLKQFPPAQ